jgi:hypothetical protein
MAPMAKSIRLSGISMTTTRTRGCGMRISLMDSSIPVIGRPLLPVVLDVAINEFWTSTLVVSWIGA